MDREREREQSADTRIRFVVPASLLTFPLRLSRCTTDRDRFDWIFPTGGLFWKQFILLCMCACVYDVRIQRTTTAEVISSTLLHPNLNYMRPQEVWPSYAIMEAMLAGRTFQLLFRLRKTMTKLPPKNKCSLEILTAINDKQKSC